MSERLVTQGKATDAYECGKQCRMRGEDFRNPYARGTVEARQFYEGYCEANLVRWMQQHR